MHGTSDALKNVKPWKSLDDQISILKGRGLTIEDENAAKDYLRRIGYYRLSGYWYPFREMNSQHLGKNPSRLDTFIQGSRFEDAVKLYVFDKKLRLLAMDALERIEMALRVDVAHLLGKHDPCAHQNPQLLHGSFVKRPIKKRGPHFGKTEHEVWLEKHEEKTKKSREPFIDHHNRFYNGCIPIWVAIEIWDFGMLSRLFAGMRYPDQDEIGARYGVKGETIEQWLRSLNFVRNVSAHHSRLWNANIVEVSAPHVLFPKVPNSRAFMYFCAISHLLSVICPNTSWQSRFVALMEEFPEVPNESVKPEDMGLVDGWKEWAIWAKK